MSEKTSERVFLALAIATVTLVSITSNGSAHQRFMDAAYEAISTSLVLNVLVFIGIFSASVMFFTNFVLLRMPYSFDSTALYSTDSWIALTLLLGLAATGYWMAANPRSERWRSI